MTLPLRQGGGIITIFFKERGFVPWGTILPYAAESAGSPDRLTIRFPYSSSTYHPHDLLTLREMEGKRDAVSAAKAGNLAHPKTQLADLDIQRFSPEGTLSQEGLIRSC